MFKNVASQKIALFVYDSTTGAPKTGDSANLTPYVSKDYGAVTVLATTTATEMDATNAKGWYSFTLAQAETSGDALLFTGKSSTANAFVVGALIYTDPPNFSALSLDGSGKVDASLLLDLSNGVETSWTLRQALRIILSAIAGKASGLATTTATYRDMADTKNRISATVDSSGDRSAVTLDAS